MADSGSDLSGLSMKRATPNMSNTYIPKRNKAAIFIIAFVVVMVGIFAYAGKNHFLPATEVNVVQALAIKSNGIAIPKGELAFQSAGWIEPDPFPIKATALVSGVVKSIYIIEGSNVKKGQLIAELIDQDLQLDLKEIEAQKRQTEHEIKEMDAEIIAANAAGKQHSARIITEERKLEKLARLGEIYEKSEDSMPKIEIIKAQQDVAIQKSMINEMISEAAMLAAAEEVAKARKAAKQAALSLLENKHDRINLALERTKIYSPANGIILRMFARSGSTLNQDSMSDDATTVAELYETDKLQVRVDVPLSDAGGLSIGQKAMVTVEIIPDRELEGVVTSIVGRADITRNTLQTKVKIIDPDDKLRPEMLAKVKFFSIGNITKETEGMSEERVRVFIPEKSVHDGNKVWVLDRISRTVVPMEITLGHEIRDNWIEVTTGINAGQQVIIGDTSKLSSGMRVEAIRDEE